jgi:predicted esterase
VRQGLVVALALCALNVRVAVSQADAGVQIDSTTGRVAGDLPGGRVYQRLMSRADTTQRYALYLPTSYSREKQWPVLFLLDPRGRALIPMHRFRPAAEQLGYIVISSYNTLSDGPPQPNYAAMSAMLADVQTALSIDSRRLYLVGFSGTTRFAWQVSTHELVGNIAGIIGAGAGVPGSRAWIRSNIGKSAPVLYGTIGTLDANFEEVRQLDEELDAIGTPHHVERFDGGHQWPPVDVSTRAVEWIQLAAFQRNLAPRNQAWVDSLSAAWFAQAARIDSSGDAWSALRQYKQLRADFPGLADVSRADARIAALANDARAKRGEAAELAASQRDLRAMGDLVSFSSAFVQSSSPPSLDEARKRLDLDKLRKDASRTDDPTAALAAKRGLERIFTHMSFYQPREMFDQRRYAHAAASLRIAHYIKPDDGSACFSLARALAQTGDKPGALQALECAAASKQLTAADIEGDSLLMPLRGEARYDAVVRQLRGS